MPKRRTHNRFDYGTGIAIYYGQFSWLHRLMNSPSKFLGPRHRKYYHDMEFVNYIHTNYGFRAALAAYWHIQLDYFFHIWKNQ